jgi:prepilin-type processing-associated H-X9-DG protein
VNSNPPFTPFIIFVMPYLEENARFALYDRKVDWNAQPLPVLDQLRSPLPTFQCPSDEGQVMEFTSTDPSNSSLFRDHKGNYGVNWGQSTYADQLDERTQIVPSVTPIPPPLALRPNDSESQRRAPFARNWGAKFGQITDGTSHTLAVMEMLQAPSTGTTTATGLDRRGRIWNHVPGTYQISTYLPPNGTYGRGAPATGNGGDETACTHRPELTLPCTTGANENAMHLGARSRHAGGVNVVMCDSSTHFISDDIDHLLWQGLSSRDGGEVVALP